MIHPTLHEFLLRSSFLFLPSQASRFLRLHLPSIASPRCFGIRGRSMDLIFACKPWASSYLISLISKMLTDSFFFILMVVEKKKPLGLSNWSFTDYHEKIDLEA